MKLLFRYQAFILILLSFFIIDESYLLAATVFFSYLGLFYFYVSLFIVIYNTVHYFWFTFLCILANAEKSCNHHHNQDSSTIQGTPFCYYLAINPILIPTPDKYYSFCHSFSCPSLNTFLKILNNVFGLKI